MNIRKSDRRFIRNLISMRLDSISNRYESICLCNEKYQDHPLYRMYVAIDRHTGEIVPDCPCEIMFTERLENFCKLKSDAYKAEEYQYLREIYYYATKIGAN